MRRSTVQVADRAGVAVRQARVMLLGDGVSSRAFHKSVAGWLNERRPRIYGRTPGLGDLRIRPTKTQAPGDRGARTGDRPGVAVEQKRRVRHQEISVELERDLVGILRT